MRLFAVFAFVALALGFVPSVRAGDTAPTRVAATPVPSPERLLALIRRQFRSHRPPPPFEAYTIERRQNAENGYPDYSESYTYHVWERTSDKAALARKVYHDDYFGDLEFQRPAFNEARDPGPPTADLFEPAPVHAHGVDFVPTPEPAGPLKTITSVTSYGEFDYRVTKVQTEGDLLHLTVAPRREPDRNRLRELYVDKKTLELKKVVATDKLFVQQGPTYPVIFTVDLEMLKGIPVVTHIHGDVDKSYVGDGEVVDYDFRDIRFPKHLPDWYFDARQYRQHKAEAPE
ncbi:MAG: hypothetical protein M3Y18_07875 [Candidatus Eremiobacteraeota bacterium]|nr:hypothetical protein [Candidatus Eremiobacteraeota bacterium]